MLFPWDGKDDVVQSYRRLISKNRVDGFILSDIDFDDPRKVVEYGQTGRVKLTTLTKEFFMPGFLERDEGEREPPYERYPWDGVSGVRPFHGFASATTVGVY